MRGLEHILVPAGGQDGGHRGLADVAAASAAVFFEQRVEGLDPAQAHQVVQVLARVREVLAQVGVDFQAALFELHLKQRLDQRHAAAAAGPGLGAGLEVSHRSAAAVDGGHQRALAHVVAGADLRRGRQLVGSEGRFGAAIGQDQRLRLGRQLDAVQAVLQQAAVVGRVADQHRAQQALAVAIDHQFLVHAGLIVLVGVAQRAGRSGVGIADAAHVHAQQFQLGAHVGTGEAGLATAKVCGGGFGHLVTGRHQAVDAPAPQRALADGVDVGVGRAALVVDHDAAALADFKTAGPGQLVARPDAGREHDQIRFQVLAVRKYHALAAGFAVHDLARVAPGVHAHAQRLDLAPQQAAAAAVQLHAHQLRRELHHVRLQAQRLERVGGLQPQQTAADHHADPRALRRVTDRIQIVQRAVHEAARALAPRHRRHERKRAAGDHQLVVG